MYCRICLKETNYTEISYKVLDVSWFGKMQEIYAQYAKAKNLQSVLPIFLEEVNAANTEIIGYFDNGENLEAFSLIYLYPSQNSCLADQFAWNYNNPRKKLGYRSVRSECARYKRLGFDYLYLGETAPYKQELQGFEFV